MDFSGIEVPDVTRASRLVSFTFKSGYRFRSSDHWTLCYSPWNSCFFFKVFLSDTFTCPLLLPLVPLFWISGDVSSGFQSQSGFCLICIVEANVMYISWDPPLVLHIADLSMDSIAGCWLGSYLAQGYYCVVAVSLEPAINRSWVLRDNHLATRPGLSPWNSWATPNVDLNIMRCPDKKNHLILNP